MTLARRGDRRAMHHATVARDRLGPGAGIYQVMPSGWLIAGHSYEHAAAKARQRVRCPPGCQVCAQAREYRLRIEQNGFRPDAYNDRVSDASESQHELRGICGVDEEVVS